MRTVRCAAPFTVLVRFLVTSTRSYANIDIEELLRPISHDCRGGDVNAYTRELRQQISDLRNPPRSSNPNDPEQDGGIDSIDWNAILCKSSEAMRLTTKDLRLACHITEAAFYLHGLAGLHDGLRLTRRLIQDYWNDLAPLIDPTDPETRCAPLENLLNDPTHGPRLPAAIRTRPLLTVGELQLSLSTAMRPSDAINNASIDSSLRQIPTDRARSLSLDLDNAIMELNELQRDLIERMKDYAPAFNHLSESLCLIRRWFDTALQHQLQASDVGIKRFDDNETSAASMIASQGQVSFKGTSGVQSQGDLGLLVEQSLRVRADAYRQLTEAANVLQRMEPHSPIPYMVHRAVQMGQMSFPKLMSQWVREESTLEMFCRELGLTSIDSSNSRDEN